MSTQTINSTASAKRSAPSHTTQSAHKWLDLLAPISRILMAGMFVMSGVSKIGQFEQTQGYMEMMGVPGVLLPLVIITEALGGLAIILGFKTRLVAFLLAGFSIVSAIFFHANFADQTQMIMFMKNITIAGGFLMLVVHGAGAYSLDNRKQ